MHILAMNCNGQVTKKMAGMDKSQKMVGMDKFSSMRCTRGLDFEEHMLWCPMLGATEGGILLVLEHHVRELH